MTRMSRLIAVGILASVVAIGGCGNTQRHGTPVAPSSTAAAPGPSTVPPPATSPPPTSPAEPPATVAIQVWFLSSSHASTGEEPLYEPVDRHVHPPAVASGALDALFAGPTTAEQAAGLRLITSGATGYTRLHIEDRIAYVTLEGGCASNGSTMTIAGEIMPTLRQFSSVTYVKIFGPDGTTETPTGPVDSIPTCLEP